MGDANVAKSNTKTVVACPGCRTKYDLTTVADSRCVNCKHCGAIVRLPKKKPPAPGQVGQLFGEIAVKMGYITPKQLKEALYILDQHKEAGRPTRLGEILLKKGFASSDQVGRVLQAQGSKVAHVVPGYEIVEKLGKGGMGSVYKALHVSSKKTVAIKLLSDALTSRDVFLERFHREARTAIDLDHKHVVKGYDEGCAGDLHYFAMEYVHGKSIARVLKKRKGFGEKRAMDVIRQIAEGLAHAHEKGVIHRDIKPDNIMMTKDGVAKLADYGLVKFADDLEGAELTSAGQIMGTPNYISPEQAKGEAEIDIRSDIYSLGATLYHMLTGEPPYTGPNLMAILKQHRSAPPPDPRKARDTISDRAAAICMRMMAKKPADRFQTPKELLKEIKGYFRKVTSAADIAAPSGHYPPSPTPIGMQSDPDTKEHDSVDDVAVSKADHDAPTQKDKKRRKRKSAAATSGNQSKPEVVPADFDPANSDPGASDVGASTPGGSSASAASGTLGGVSAVIPPAWVRPALWSAGGVAALLLIGMISMALFGGSGTTPRAPTEEDVPAALGLAAPRYVPVDLALGQGETHDAGALYRAALLTEAPGERLRLLETMLRKAPSAAVSEVAQEEVERLRAWRQEIRQERQEKKREKLEAKQAALEEKARAAYTEALGITDEARYVEAMQRVIADFAGTEYATSAAERLEKHRESIARKKQEEAEALKRERAEAAATKRAQEEASLGPVRRKFMRVFLPALRQGDTGRAAAYAKALAKDTRNPGLQGFGKELVRDMEILKGFVPALAAGIESRKDQKVTFTVRDLRSAQPGATKQITFKVKYVDSKHLDIVGTDGRTRMSIPLLTLAPKDMVTYYGAGKGAGDPRAAVALHLFAHEPEAFADFLETVSGPQGNHLRALHEYARDAE